MKKTVRYEIVADDVLEELARHAINAKDSDNFLGYAGSISQFHDYVASMAIELQHYRMIHLCGLHTDNLHDGVTKIIETIDTAEE